jgi:hypothetical protein
VRLCEPFFCSNRDFVRTAPSSNCAFVRNVLPVPGPKTVTLGESSPLCSRSLMYLLSSQIGEHSLSMSMLGLRRLLHTYILDNGRLCLSHITLISTFGRAIPAQLKGVFMRKPTFEQSLTAPNRSDKKWRDCPHLLIV